MGLKRHIPNAITSCNLLSGVVGLVFAFSGRADLAFFMMLAAGAFDFCDGLAARALGVSSPLGRELDSLSDAVSFGVLPSAMLFTAMPEGLTRWITLLPAVFSALRLAKFNLDERQHSGFLGLPTPSSAILCGSIAAYAFFRPTSWLGQLCATPWFLPVLAALLCFLLVCEIPFFAFKKAQDGASFPVLSLKRTAFFCLAALAVIVTAVLGWHWTAVPLLVFASYILENLVFAVFRV